MFNWVKCIAKGHSSSMPYLRRLCMWIWLQCCVILLTCTAETLVIILFGGNTVLAVLGKTSEVLNLTQLHPNAILSGPNRPDHCSSAASKNDWPQTVLVMPANHKMLEGFKEFICNVLKPLFICVYESDQGEWSFSYSLLMFSDMLGSLMTSSRDLLHMSNVDNRREKSVLYWILNLDAIMRQPTFTWIFPFCTVLYFLYLYIMYFDASCWLTRFM